MIGLMENGQDRFQDRISRQNNPCSRNISSLLQVLLFYRNLQSLRTGSARSDVLFPDLSMSQNVQALPMEMSCFQRTLHRILYMRWPCLSHSSPLQSGSSLQVRQIRVLQCAGLHIDVALQPVAWMNAAEQYMKIGNLQHFF